MTTLTLTKGPRPAGVIDTGILVAGAGPAGLATAITAARHGARVLVVERRPGTSTVPGRPGSALTQWSCSALGGSRTRFAMRAWPASLLRPYDAPSPPNPWPSSRSASRRCERRLRHDTAGSILATVGGHRVRAKFVVGADGPRSTVRSLLGIGVEHLGTLGGHALVVFRPDVAALLDAGRMD